jgi:hypothetical protein
MNRWRALGWILAAPAARGISQASDDPARLEVGGAAIDVEFGAGDFEVGRPALLDWGTVSSHAVSAYYGRFSVAHARVRILASQSGRISGGTSFGAGGAHRRIVVGEQVTRACLRNDWELTHEMVHFAFPSVEDRHRWIEEGSATYDEPIARAMIIEVHWPLDQVIEIGDNTAGSGVLSGLYRQMALEPAMVDLQDLWGQLWVIRAGNTVNFDSQAPLAAIRTSIAG